MEIKYFLAFCFVFFLFIHQAKSQLDSASFGQKFGKKIPSKNLLKHSKDTSEKDTVSRYEKIKKKVGLGGSVGIEYLYRNNSYLGQNKQDHIIRTTLNPNFKVAGIPFNTNINLTTEGKQIGYNLNNFSLGFDLNRFKEELIQKAKQKAVSDYDIRDSVKRYYEEKLNIDNALDSLYKQRDLLKNSISQNGKFQIPDSLKNKIPGVDTAAWKQRLADSIGRHKNIERPDSLMPDTGKYGAYVKENIRKQKQRLAKIEKALKKLEQQKEKYEKLKSSGYFDRSLTTEDNDIRDNVQKLRKHHSLSRLDALFLSVKNIEVGNIMPAYGPLFMQGMRLTGVNTEIQYNKLYVAGIIGVGGRKAGFNVAQPFDFTNFTYGIRLGLGDDKNTNFRVSYLDNKELSRNDGKDIQSFDYMNPKKNKVYYLSGQYKLARNWFLRGEIASSQSKELLIRNNYQTQSEISGQKAVPQVYEINTTNTAYIAELEGEISRTKTKIKLSHSRNNPAFFTSGNPYLRTDISQTKISIGQNFLRNVIKCKVQASESRDNLQGFKAYTTGVRTVQGSVAFKYKKYPMVNVFNLYTVQSNTNGDSAMTTPTLPVGENIRFKNVIKVIGTTVTKSWTIRKKYLNIHSFTYQNNIFSSNIGTGYKNTTLSYLNSMQVDNIGISYTGTCNIVRASVLNYTHTLGGDYAFKTKIPQAASTAVTYTFDMVYGMKIGMQAGYKIRFKTYAASVMSQYNLLGNNSGLISYNKQFTTSINLTKQL